MFRWLPRFVLACLGLLTFSASARADRRYFVQSYTPYLAPAGSLELEVWAIARAGQGDSTNTAWQTRSEFEYAITDRLTGALYLNFVQEGQPEAPQRFDGPSLEIIYRLAEPGRLPLEPAAYFEVRENGDELELEPKLLLGARHQEWVAAANLIGELEILHRTEPGEPDREKSLAVTAGLSRELGARLALGIEGRYQRVFEDEGDDPSAFFAGPTINLQTPKIQLAMGWHPQLSGSPKSAASLNLADWPRSEFRMILGVGL